jgi:hypothetical protein
MMVSEREAERAKRLNQLYLAIISRYKSYIEEKEELSVAELPTIVAHRGAMVAKKAAEIKSEFPSYSYDSDFPGASKKAFEFVRDSVEEISMPIQFWLDPDETLSFLMGDLIDKNVLLCSLLINLGNPGSKVLVIKRESSMDIYTHFEFGGKIFLADLNKEMRTFESYDSMISAFGISEADTAYEFNNQSYADIYPKQQ